MRQIDIRPLAATCTFALRLPNKEYIRSIAGKYVDTTEHVDDAHLWIWPLDESDERRAARIAEARKRIGYPPSVEVTAVRAR